VAFLLVGREEAVVPVLVVWAGGDAVNLECLDVSYWGSTCTHLHACPCARGQERVGKRHGLHGAYHIGKLGDPWECILLRDFGAQAAPAVELHLHDGGAEVKHDGRLVSVGREGLVDEVDGRAGTLVVHLCGVDVDAAMGRNGGKVRLREVAWRRLEVERRVDRERVARDARQV